MHLHQHLQERLSHRESTDLPAQEALQQVQAQGRVRRRRFAQVILH